MAIDKSRIRPVKDIFDEGESYHVYVESLGPDLVIEDAVTGLVFYEDSAALLRFDIEAVRQIDCVEAGSRFSCTLRLTTEGCECRELEKMVVY